MDIANAVKSVAVLVSRVGAFLQGGVGGLNGGFLGRGILGPHRVFTNDTRVACLGLLYFVRCGRGGFGIDAEIGRVLLFFGRRERNAWPARRPTRFNPTRFLRRSPIPDVLPFSGLVGPKQLGVDVIRYAGGSGRYHGGIQPFSFVAHIEFFPRGKLGLQLVRVQPFCAIRNSAAKERHQQNRQGPAYLARVGAEKI